MAALAGLVPPLFFSVALVAGLRRGSRRQRDAEDAGSTARTKSGVDTGGVAAEAAHHEAAHQDAAHHELGCRACGWPLDRPGWVDGHPTSAICDCCACEAGVDDLTPDRALAYRRRWVEHGAEWFDPGSRPESWDLYAHLCELAPV